MDILEFNVTWQDAGCICVNAHQDILKEIETLLEIDKDMSEVSHFLMEPNFEQLDAVDFSVLILLGVSEEAS